MGKKGISDQNFNVFSIRTYSHIMMKEHYLMDLAMEVIHNSRMFYCNAMLLRKTYLPKLFFFVDLITTSL